MKIGFIFNKCAMGKKREHIQGFTLLELMAVIIILSVITAISIPLFHNKTDNAKQTAISRNISILQKQAQSYMLDQNTLPVGDITKELIKKGYVKDIPINSTNTGNTYSVIANKNATVTVSLTGNKPKIVANMTPVYWDGDSWEVTTEENIDNEWYKYNGDIDNSDDTNKNDGIVTAVNISEEKWANIILNDGSIFVWIPRFSYKINKNGENSNIWIKYSCDINDDTSNGFKSHPAFNFGGNQLTGIWVAKFEASKGVVDATPNADNGFIGNQIKIIPAAASWKQITINDMFNECLEMKEERGLPAETDTHMMKQTEWGAIAYLTEALRDGEEVGFNDNENYYTGGSSIESVVYSTNIKQSNLGNAFGIYDLNGGTHEYLASYIDNNNENLSINGASLTAESTPEKYRNKIVMPDQGSGQANFDYVSNELGEALVDGWALHETMDKGEMLPPDITPNSFQGYGDMPWFPFDNNPFFGRGGYYANGSYGGIYSSYYGNGDKKSFGTFRPVLVVFN